MYMLEESIESCVLVNSVWNRLCYGHSTHQTQPLPCSLRDWLLGIGFTYRTEYYRNKVFHYISGLNFMECMWHRYTQAHPGLVPG